MVNGLVVWLERLLLSILLVCGIFNITFFVKNWWFSRLANCLIVKTYFPYYLSFLTLSKRSVVIICIKECCHHLHFSICSHHPCQYDNSVYPINPPNLHVWRRGCWRTKEIYWPKGTERVHCFQNWMLIGYFHVSIVECSVYVLVFRISNNFLCSWWFSCLAKAFDWKDCCCPYY